MAYSSEEIQAAVEQLVRSTIRRSVDKSGVRQTDVEFSDIQEVAASAFINHPDAVYYILSLGSDRLNSICVQLVADIDSLIGKVDACGRRTYPINDLTSLADTENALVDLEAALASRAAGTSDPSSLPAYLRFESSSLKYLNHIGGNVKSDGDIVETPNQAKVEIPGLFNSIMESYEKVLDDQYTLRTGVEDFLGMQLPIKVVTNVIQKARGVLGSDYDELAGLSEEERLEVARTKTLNILTARAVVAAYIGGQQVLDSYTFSGQVRPYADGNHDAEPASVTGDVEGPYAIVTYPALPDYSPDPRDNNILNFTLEGSTPVKVILPASMIAFLLGTGRPFDDPDWDDPEDPAPKVYVFYKKGAPTTEWPNGRGWAENFTGNEDKPETWYFPPDNNILYIDQLLDDGTYTRYTVDFMTGAVPITFTPDTGNDPPNDEPWDAYRTKLPIELVVLLIQTVLTATPPTYIQCVAKALGSDPLVNTNIQIECIDPIESVVNRVVGIRIPSVIVDGVETNTAALAPLGLIPGLEMWCKRTPATQVVSWTEANTSRVDPSSGAIARVSSLDHMRAWTNLADKAGAILAKWTGYVNCSGGSTITLTVSQYLTKFTDWGIAVGDVVFLPRQYVSTAGVFEPWPDEGAKYIVTSVSDQTITASHVSGPTAIAFYMRNVDIGLPEVLTQVQQYDVVQIYTAPNEGGFEITSIDTYSPLRVHFGLMLSQNKEDRENKELELEVTVGPATVSFASANTLTQSQIRVEGTARSLFFSTVPDARGRTKYVQMPDQSPRVQVGDKLQLWESTSPDVRYERTIKLIEGKILTLDDTVPSDMVFTAEASVPPSVTILSGKSQSFSSFKLELESWDSVQPTDPDLYKADTNAKLNPILANHTPAAGRVAEAKSAIQTLRDKVVALSEELQTQIGVAAVRAVDDLIATLKSKGADRGVDLLLEGRFSEFFGLDMDEMTYMGTMQKAARDVARNDLAVSRFGTKRRQRKIMAAYDSTDPDYDLSDSEALRSPPDPSAGYDLPSAPDPA